MKKTAIYILCFNIGYFLPELFYKSSTFEIKTYVLFGVVIVSTTLLIIDLIKNKKFDK